MSILTSVLPTEQDCMNILAEITKIYKDGDGDGDGMEEMIDILFKADTLYDMNVAKNNIVIKLRARRMMGR